MSEKSELTEEQIAEILNPDNLDPLGRRIVERMKKRGATPREIAEFLYYQT